MEAKGIIQHGKDMRQVARRIIAMAEMYETAEATNDTRMAETCEAYLKSYLSQARTLCDAIEARSK